MHPNRENLHLPLWPAPSGREHTYENRAALENLVDSNDLAALDQEFPPPLHAQPLEML